MARREEGPLLRAILLPHRPQHPPSFRPNECRLPHLLDHAFPRLRSISRCFLPSSKRTRSNLLSTFDSRVASRIHSIDVREEVLSEVLVVAYAGNRRDIWFAVRTIRKEEKRGSRRREKEGRVGRVGFLSFFVLFVFVSLPFLLPFSRLAIDEYTFEIRLPSLLKI